MNNEKQVLRFAQDDTLACFSFFIKSKQKLVILSGARAARVAKDLLLWEPS